MLKIEFKITSAAQHEDGNIDTYEIADMIDGVGELVRDGYTSGFVYDANGNTVGSWSLTEED